MRHDVLTRLCGALETAAGTTSQTKCFWRDRSGVFRFLCSQASLGAERLPTPAFTKTRDADAPVVATSRVCTRQSEPGESGLLQWSGNTGNTPSCRNVYSADTSTCSISRLSPAARSLDSEDRYATKKKGLRGRRSECDYEPPSTREWSAQTVPEAFCLLGSGGSLAPPSFGPFFSAGGRRFLHSRLRVGFQKSDQEKDKHNVRVFSTHMGRQRAEMEKTRRREGLVEEGFGEAEVTGRRESVRAAERQERSDGTEDALWRKEADSLSEEARKLQCLYHSRSSYLWDEKQTLRPRLPAWLRQNCDEDREGEKRVKPRKADGAAVCVILVNLGSPSAPTYTELWKYLNQFLGDPRVVELPSFLWSFIRYLFILPFRSYASAQKYQSIWNFDPGFKLCASQSHVNKSSSLQSRVLGGAQTEAVRQTQVQAVQPIPEEPCTVSTSAEVEARKAKDRRGGKNSIMYAERSAKDATQRAQAPFSSLETEDKNTVYPVSGSSGFGSSRDSRIATSDMHQGERDFSGAPAPLVRITECLRSKVQARFDTLLLHLSERERRGKRDARYDENCLERGDSSRHRGENLFSLDRDKRGEALSKAGARCPPGHAREQSKGDTREDPFLYPESGETQASACSLAGNSDRHSFLERSDYDAARRLQPAVRVLMAMRYGEPSLPSVLREARKGGCRKLLILPLYPQSAASTTSSVYDAAMQEIMKWRVMPDLRLLSGYADHPAYIAALAATVRRFWEAKETAKNARSESSGARGRGEKLIFSFHGIPLNTGRQAGEIYQCLCAKTARLTAEQLQLKPEEFEVAFQSRFGPAEWTQPYMDKRLEALAVAGYRFVDVVMPGFATDCLETIEEMASVYRGKFLELTHGEGELRVLPCLNASEEATAAVFAIAREQMTDWLKLMVPLEGEKNP
ncbi:protoheme ferro-lyase, putative [Toxoplasma gondii ME49]|uniref:Protoheme ferro-lyase n=3 Tax=Toxoplasma gondii TaxID=5811 RepID=A0A125YXC5_TOXGV|nr:protoheme ferro-lyase, putative [Toxoplasma gondii ME49]EPT29364.1 protoheme ferro-lyase, putative [Toxoplasma gondii ME49]ESS32218.1 putative protoheme ferro-lyase [Toxoplasma gondii VEG]KYF41716.1 putative protoheme ferro-lyase [Toxoplasma gondii ARI]|eukprot:XP_018637025.1 protoheme ferro-lyase, putative [Toxoplasma gondii ME49]